MQPACSLHGFTNTLVVNRQGLGDHLPSLAHRDRERDLAVVMDEITERQVSYNKQFFQAGACSAELGQSACNPFSSSLFVYRLPITCCSKAFKMSTDDGWSPEDANCIQANMIAVPVPLSG